MIARLAWRSIWRNRRRTVITVLSIGLGLAIAIFFISLGEGFYSRLVDDSVRMEAGHITLENPEYQNTPAIDLTIEGVDRLRRRIERIGNVERTKLLILGQGVANSGAGSSGVSIMGVEPSVEVITSPLARQIVAGGYLTDSDAGRVVLGQSLADQLRLRLGSKMVLTVNNAQGQLVEELCRVKGIFSTGSDETDGHLIQVPLNFARRLFGLGPNTATRLGVILNQAANQNSVVEDIKVAVRGENIAVLPWQEILQEVASYIRMDRVSNWVFQVLLLIIILFTILNTLLMSVVEREREFAVLLALGTPVNQLKKQLFMESFYIGWLGCLIGMLLGVPSTLVLQIRGLNMASFLSKGVTISGFAISTIVHSRLTPGIIVWTGGTVLGATLLLSFIPMRRINRVQIAENLK